MVLVLSLDASTTTIGWALFSHDNGKDIKLIKHDFYKPPKDGSIFERLSITKKYICDLITELEPDDLVIEDIVQFMAGGSGAKTIIPLAVFNRTLGLSYYEMTGKQPHLLNVMAIRHTLKTNKKLPAKEDMPELVAKHLKIKFPYFTKYNKRKKKDEICPEVFDVADAMAVGLAFIKRSSLSV